MARPEGQFQPTPGFSPGNFVLGANSKPGASNRREKGEANPWQAPEGRGQSEGHRIAANGGRAVLAPALLGRKRALSAPALEEILGLQGRRPLPFLMQAALAWAVIIGAIYASAQAGCAIEIR